MTIPSSRHIIAYRVNLKLFGSGVVIEEHHAACILVESPSGGKEWLNFFILAEEEFGKAIRTIAFSFRWLRSNHGMVVRLE